MGGIAILILIASLAGNALLVKTYMGARDDRAKATEQRDAAIVTAKACSDGTADLVKQAEKRGAEGAQRAASAAKAALPHKKRAQRILSSPPSTPGNACKSAEDAVDEWLRGRKP